MNGSSVEGQELHVDSNEPALIDPEQPLDLSRAESQHIRFRRI